jgi:hypothetical protein
MADNDQFFMGMFASVRIVNAHTSREEWSSFESTW